MRGVFFFLKEEIFVMYLVLVFYYKSFVIFGYVNINVDDVYKILKRFNLYSGYKSLLMFNEDVQFFVVFFSVGIFFMIIVNIYCLDCNF